MKRALKLLLILISGILLMSSCDTERPMEESQYKKDNDAFIEKAVEKGYAQRQFLNADYPFYYKVITESTKEKAKYPLQDSQVRVMLSGRLITGEVFQKEAEINLSVSKLVMGVQYALQSMSEGDRWEVVLPYQLGYGAYAQGTVIPGYSTLIFDIELLEVTVQ